MSDHFELLREAIERNTAITLAVPSAGITRTCKSRLLELRDDAVYLESVAGEGDAIDAAITAGVPIKVSFRADTQNVEFLAPPFERLRGYRLNANVVIEALRVGRPTTVRVVQRRADYRVTITPDTEVQFKCWRVSEQYDLQDAPPAATSSMKLVVRDLSAGGLGGLWKRRKDESPTLVANQRLRVDISCATGAVTLDGRLRFLAAVPDPDSSRIGIQFGLKTANMADRQKIALLTKLIGELQRAELKRLKMAR